MKPNEDQPKLFAIHQTQHDGRIIGEKLEYFPEPAHQQPKDWQLDRALEDKQGKIRALIGLNTYLGQENRARVLNLWRMTEDHPSAKKHDLVANASTAESIFYEAGLYLLQACGHCALRGAGCEIDSQIKKFVIKHPTKDSRQALIDLNADNPQVSC
jgi:hypothetical protein